MFGECQTTFNEKLAVWEGMSYFPVWLKALSTPFSVPDILFLCHSHSFVLVPHCLTHPIHQTGTLLSYYPAFYIVQTCHNFHRFFLASYYLVNSSNIYHNLVRATRRNIVYLMKKGESPDRGLQTTSEAEHEHLKINSVNVA